jgi:hypothetical protein
LRSGINYWESYGEMRKKGGGVQGDAFRVLLSLEEHYTCEYDFLTPEYRIF